MTGVQSGGGLRSCARGEGGGAGARDKPEWQKPAISALPDRSVCGGGQPTLLAAAVAGLNASLFLHNERVSVSWKPAGGRPLGCLRPRA